MNENIQWYPGHMTKTRRQIESYLPLIDAVAEICDARIPLSSRNPDLDEILRGKPRLIILNKADMADPEATAAFVTLFSRQGYHALAADCRSGKGLSRFLPLLKTILKDKLARYEKKGLVGKPLRVMVVGIPNVGKSSFINRMAKSARAKVADRPGVTRGSQWFTIDRQVELLDTPGVLWPKLDDYEAAKRLAYTGAVKDTVLDTEALAAALLTDLQGRYPLQLAGRYRLTAEPEMSGAAMLEEVGRSRGMLMRGGEVDTLRAAQMVLDEFRGAKLGRITLDQIEE